MPPRLRTTRLALLAVIALVAITLMAVPGNATFAKKYDLTMSPPTATAGMPTTFTATYTNKSLYKIGSTDLTAPAGFTITSASSSKGTSTFTSTKVSVRNLALALNYSFAITVTVNVACGTASPATWSASTWTGTTSLSGSQFFLNNPGTAQKTNVSPCAQTLTVTKYEDVDVSHGRDAEPGLPGWTFDLWAGSSATGSPLATSGPTGEDGTTTFPGLTPGEYYVCERTQPGWTNTDPMSASGCKTATVGNSGGSVVFGNAANATLNILKYNDANLSGSMDPGEAPLGGWDFSLHAGDSSAGSVLDTTTTVDGIASFTVAAGGTYTVCETIREGWSNTDPADGLGCRTVSSTATTSAASIDLEFGNIEGTVKQIGCDPDNNTAIIPGVTIVRQETVCDPISYVLTRTGDSVTFIKNLETQPNATFRVEVNAYDPEPAQNPVPATVVDTPAPPHDIQWCEGTVANPVLPPLVVQPPGPTAYEVTCLLTQYTEVAGGGQMQVTETYYLQGDIIWKR